MITTRAPDGANKGVVEFSKDVNTKLTESNDDICNYSSSSSDVSRLM